MRILVGTLYCGENELDRCVDAVKSQHHGCVEHQVFKWLPDREAHNTLYNAFFSRRDEFDLLVKVDADMVLIDRAFFSRVVDRFQRHPEIELLTVGVEDFFTGGMIGGLNTYRNSIAWSATDDNVYTDRLDVPNERRMSDYSDLAPAAWHCPDPSPLQAFHFGVHRGIKARVGAETDQPGPLAAHLRTVERTWRHFTRLGDRRLALASLGAELALSGRFAPEHISYMNPTIADYFATISDAETETLTRETQRLRYSNWAFLPTSIRAELLRRRDLSLPFRLLVPQKTRRRLKSAFDRCRQVFSRRGSCAQKPV